MKKTLLALSILAFSLSLHSQSNITAEEARSLVEEYLSDCMLQKNPNFYIHYFDVEEDAENIYSLYQYLYQYKIHKVKPPWVEVLASFSEPEEWDRIYSYKLVKKEGRLYIVPKNQKDWYGMNFQPFQEEQIISRPFTADDARYFRAAVMEANGLEEVDIDNSYHQLLGDWVVKETKGYRSFHFQELSKRFNFKPDGKLGERGDWFVADSLLFVRFPDESGYKKFEMYPLKDGSLWLDLIEPLGEDLGVQIVRLEEATAPTGKVLHEGILPNGEILIQPFFEELSCVGPNRIIFERHARAGLMDTLMQVIIPAEYDKILVSSEEQVFFAVSNGRTHMYDSTGSLVQELDFKVELGWLNGHYFIGQNGKKGTMDPLGNIIIEPIYDALKPSSLFAYKARKGEKEGLLDFAGNELMPFEYNYMECRTDKLAIVKKGKHYGVINYKSGELIIPVKYDYMEIEGKPVIIAFKEGRVLLFSTDGNRLTDQAYDLISWFGWNYLGVEKDGKRGVVNDAGETVLPIEYDNVIGADFTVKGVFEVVLNGQEAFVDSTGMVIKTEVLEKRKEIIREQESKRWETEFELADDDRITFKGINNRYAFYDSRGKMALPPIYDIYPLEYESGFVLDKNGLKGMIDQYGEELLPFIFQDIYECSQSGLFIVEFQDKKGLVHTRRQSLRPQPVPYKVKNPAMRQKDLEALLHFVIRTGMYAAEEEHAVVAFVYGYELGTERQYKLTEEINEYLFSKYGLPKTAYSWPGQIRKFAEENELSWLASFRRLMLRYFYDRYDLDETPELMNLVKSTVERMMERFQEREPAGAVPIPMDNWKGLVDLAEPQFRKCWTEEQLQLMEQIDKKLSGKR